MFDFGVSHWENLLALLFRGCYIVWVSRVLLEFWGVTYYYELSYSNFVVLLCYFGALIFPADIFSVWVPIHFIVWLPCDLAAPFLPK